MIRFQVWVDRETFEALRALAQQEYRDWRLQAGLLIRTALVSRGLIQSPQPGRPVGLETGTGAGEPAPEAGG